MRRLALFPLALCTLACSLPRDADGTLERVRGGVLRVGVIDDPPFTVDSAGTVAGVEGRLVGELARELGARVQWSRRPAHALVAALHDRELDLLIGGLTADLAWKQDVAFTRPYLTDSVVVGIDSGAAPLPGVRGVEVLVESGSAESGALRRMGASPRPVESLEGTRGPALAPTWRLARLGRRPTDVVVAERAHVLAAAPGENAFLMRVERVLFTRRDRVPLMLRRSGR